MKKSLIFALCCALLLSVLSISALAVEVPDYDRKGSISITMTYQGEVVKGGSLTLYRVADVAHDNGNYFFEYTSDFAGCEVPVDDPSTSRIAEALAKIVKDKSLKGTVKSISSKGEVTFPDLEIGLYLLIQTRAATGFNAVSPFLVSVPGRENESYVYDVDASPKVELEPKPTTEPPETTKPSDKLPQTGQLNWPVPVLFVVGLIFVVLGSYMQRSGRKKQ